METEQTPGDTVYEMPRIKRAVIPMSSGGAGFMLNGEEPPPPLKPNESALIKSTPDPRHLPFRADYILLSGPCRWDWRIDELIVDGVSQIEASKPLSSRTFEPSSEGAAKLLLGQMAPITKEIVLVVTYVGLNESGEHFHCAIIGEPRPT